MDFTLNEWVQLAGDGSIADAAVKQQAEETGMTEDEVRDIMRSHLACMKEAVHTGLDEKLRSVSGLSGGQAALFFKRLEEGNLLCGRLLGKAEVYAMATAECNACMGKIVAAPTAGACGILPGSILAMMEENGATAEQAVEALFVAAAVGQSIATQASISGAEGGCQAECGSAAAMAAAALVYLQGGDPRQCVDAAAFAIMNLLGLVCDPVGGLVEVPCVYRNVGSCGVAFTAADMVLSGIRCPIAPDEVLLAMKEVGDALPSSLRETGDGGCAACPSVRARLHLNTL
ncbi:MAG: L-serine ammonia-lyase, iron-sulfur-dependent, subunit alpha [Clostridiales bacterium]|nr:L-serine ammonia-lyase, iron-sulfur-dependent, subunit alpha [Clostridiales bacterium]